MDRGIYTLIIRSEGGVIRVGALGSVVIPRGYLIYVGSALGPGGLTRMNRHLQIPLSGRKPTWHIDHLLREQTNQISATVSAETTDRLECRLAEAIGGEYIKGFGSSDCRCRSHLFERKEDPAELCREAFLSLGLMPVIRRY